MQQLRKGTGIPHVYHLLALASLFFEAGGGEDEAITALLYEAVELEYRSLLTGFACAIPNSARIVALV